MIIRKIKADELIHLPDEPAGVLGLCGSGGEEYFFFAG
jgi:hypothetical protein